MQQAAIAQAVERRIGNAEVTGPTPVSSLYEKSANLKVGLHFFCIIAVIRQKLKNV